MKLGAASHTFSPVRDFQRGDTRCDEDGVAWTTAGDRDTACFESLLERWWRTE
jgi:hypothetical protein